MVVGHDFNGGRDIDALMASMLTSGFQATNLGQAVNVVNQMVCRGWGGAIAQRRDSMRALLQISCRLDSSQHAESSDEEAEDPPPTLTEQQRRRCKIFLGFTSNLMSAGTREVVRFLCQHRMVDVLVTTAGEVGRDGRGEHAEGPPLSAFDP